MTVGFSAVNLANKWLGMLAGTAFTAPTVFAAKIHVGDPGSAGTANAAAGDTTRKTVTLAAPAGGSIAMSAISGGWTNGGTSETLTHISLWDSTTAGNFLCSIALGSPQAWASTNTYTLTTLTVALIPIAA